MLLRGRPCACFVWQTEPGGGVFEQTTICSGRRAEGRTADDELGEVGWSGLVGLPDRLNAYGNASLCAKEHPDWLRIRTICHCL